MLRFETLVRKPDEVFGDIDKVEVDDEMVELASHIIERKKAQFDPSKCEDKYEEALIELIEAEKAARSWPHAQG